MVPERGDKGLIQCNSESAIREDGIYFQRRKVKFLEICWKMQIDRVGRRAISDAKCLNPSTSPFFTCCQN